MFRPHRRGNEMMDVQRALLTPAHVRRETANLGTHIDMKEAPMIRRLPHYRAVPQLAAFRTIPRMPSTRFRK